MVNKPEPNWQPIKNLPMIADVIDGQLTDVKEQYATLLEARDKPYVLNDVIVQRTIKVYTEQIDFIWAFEEQLSIWKNEQFLTLNQKNEIDRLQGQVLELQKVLSDILTLAKELEMGTIEKVMSKSDMELGIEYLKKLKLKL